MAGLGSVTVNLGANIKDFRTKMQQAEKTFTKFGKKMQNTGKSLTMGLTLPLAGFGALAVKTFDKQEKAIAQVEAGIKSTGGAAGFTADEFKKMAADLQKVTIFGDEDILQGATAQLLTFTNIAGEQFQRTQEIALDLATRLDGDLKSSSIMLGKALNDPVANLSALSRAGIQFSDEQKKTVKALVETNRLADAQTLILNELENQYGGSAQAAAQAGLGPIQQLKNSFMDVTEQIGAILIPHLQKLATFIKGIADKFANLDTDTKELIVKIGMIAAALGPLLMAFGKVMVIIPKIARTMAMLTGPIGLIVGALAMAAVLIVQNWEKIKEYFTSGEGSQMFTTIKEIVVQTMSLISKVVQVTVQFIADIWARIGPFVMKIVTRVFNVIGNTIKTVLNFILDILGFFQRIFAGGWEGLFNGIKTFFVKIWRSIVRFLLKGLITVMKGMKKLLEAFGAKKLAAKVDNTTSSLENYGDGLKNVANGSVSTGKDIKKFNKELKEQKDTTKDVVDETLDLTKATEGYNKEIDLSNIDITNKDLKKNKKATFDATESMKEFATQFEAIDKKAEVFGEMGKDFDANAEKASLIESQITTLIDNGIDPASDEIKKLKEEFAKLGKEGKKTSEDLAKGLQKFADTAGKIMSGVGAIFSQYFEMKMQGLENDQAAEEEALQTAFDNQVEDIENSTMNQQLKDAKLQELQEAHDENMTGVQEKFQQKMAQQKKKQAIADKAMAIANAVINTAAGVASALPNIPLAAVIGAMGAAQVALIASTPIPAMAQGGIVTGPTTALIGEAGAEAVIPLDKLSSIMGEQTQTVNVVGKISGDDIILVSDRAKQNRTRVRGINS